MMISLIMATLGRIKEVRIFLESLNSQSLKNFELIVVDQNEHHEIEKIIADYPKIHIVYVRSEKKGLSYNRNIGLKYVQGDIIGFPDDDCYYDNNLFEEVSKAFNNEAVSLISVNAKGSVTGKLFIGGCSRKLTRKDLFLKCISYNFFIRKSEKMKFDEQLGVGAKFGSGEETDFLWTYLGKHDNCRMISTTSVHHPENIGAVNSERAFRYGLGFGAMMRKEIISRHHYSMLSVYLIGIIRAFGGFVIKKEKKSYYNSLKGRLNGFLTYKPI